MIRSVKKPPFSVPVRRDGMPARWCASNLILAMLTILAAIGGVIEILRG